MISFQREIISQIQTKFGEDGYKLWHFETLAFQKEEVQKLLKASLSGNQQNLLVLLEGASGSGKTETLKNAFEHLVKADYSFTTVWLNGFIHHNDEAAFNEIIRQLKIAFPEPVEGTERDFKGFQFEFIKKTLQAMKDRRKPIIFILDDFDEFATRNKQSLLYTIFDLQQKADVQVLLVGTTTRSDAFSLLEKRNRSRFSDRKVVFPTSIRNRDKARLLFEHLLCISAPTNTKQKRWNKSVRNVLTQERIKDRLGEITELQVLPTGQLESIMIEAVSQIDESKPLLTREILMDAIQLQAWQPTLIDSLRDCCLTQLVIIVAMVRLVLTKKQAKVNFVMIVDEILSNHIVRTHHRENDETIAEMLERLIDMHLIIMLDGNKKNAVQRFKRMSLAISPKRVRQYIMHMTSPGPPAWLVQYVRFASK